MGTRRAKIAISIKPQMPKGLVGWLSYDGSAFAARGWAVGGGV